MLFVVVLEFFICWTPLYVINTITLFDAKLIYDGLGYTALSFFQLLAYTSSCCNPITYCFMNCGFRKSFLNLFRCFKRIHEPTRRLSLGCSPAVPTANPLVSLNTVNNKSKKQASFLPDCRDENDEGFGELSRQPSFNNFNYHNNFNPSHIDGNGVGDLETISRRN